MKLIFIGREEELNFLESRYKESNGQLIVLYGRRRIGKTETLRKFCENKDLLPFHFIQIGRWWNKTDELDILAVDTKRKHYLVGECKYKNSQFSLHDLRIMQRKFTPADSESQLYYWLFSKNSFADEIEKKQ